ncbi:hypothetical protein GCM10028807_00130 [Spirosoma daeguense]
MGLLWACNSGQSAELEQAQAANMKLTKTLHNHLNKQDWKAAEKLCAQTVRYRGRATHFAEVDEPKARFLRHYRATLPSARTGSIEIRQLYPAGAYHVILEGISTAETSDTTLPICFIYTIEDQHITRLYAY